MAIRCECGGEFKATKLATYDFTPVAGLPAELKNVRGLKCARCGGTTLEGRIINVALSTLTIAVARLSSRLTREHSRFLRRRLGMSQQVLADRMGIVRETVAKWETGGEISPQHDYILRSMALAHCAQVAKRIDPTALVEALREVHREPGPQPPLPLILDGSRRRIEVTALVG